MTTSDPLSPTFTAERPEHYQNGGPPLQRPLQTPVHPAYLPGGSKSLSGISLRSFILGIVLGASVTMTILLLFLQDYLWRAPFFLSALALFHYLEFEMTARYNPPDAKVSSFLLSANGVAYNAAHSLALSELLIRGWLSSSLRPSWLHLPFFAPFAFPTIPGWITVVVGLVMITAGQFIRSAAMATAGKSFNHLVQSTRKDDHLLVTRGVFSISRHPAYLGFFWWAVGTQILLGNRVCLLGYIFALWNFFSARITSENYWIFGSPWLMLMQRRSRSWCSSSVKTTSRIGTELQYLYLLFDEQPQRLLLHTCYSAIVLLIHQIKDLGGTCSKASSVPEI